MHAPINQMKKWTHLLCDDPIHTLLPCQRQAACVQYLVFSPLKEKSSWLKYRLNWRPVQSAGPVNHPKQWVNSFRDAAYILIYSGMQLVIYTIPFTKEAANITCGCAYVYLQVIFLRKMYIQMPVTFPEKHTSYITHPSNPSRMKTGFGAVNLCSPAAPSGL